jgi:hypothetical protein
MTVKSATRRSPPARPRTFEEVQAANLADPFHATRIGRLSSGKRFDDATAASDDPLMRSERASRLRGRQPLAGRVGRQRRRLST